MLNLKLIEINKKAKRKQAQKNKLFTGEDKEVIDDGKNKKLFSEE